MTKKLLKALQGEKNFPPPLWLMRQAGRYLPEYRALRKKSGSFLNLCLSPDLAAEITLQPIKRFNFDAAIIFADILLLPHALGCNLRFETGEGPKLDAISSSAAIAEKQLGAELQSVYAALRLVRQNLPPETTLLGFCGAPFTVACYMVSGGGSKDFSAVHAYAQRDRTDFIRLLKILADHSITYLCEQVEAGAEALQIFESWAELVKPEDWKDFVIHPARRIVAGVKTRFPDIPIIGFPRGAGRRYHGYAVQTGMAALGLDQKVPLPEAAELQKETVVQGNLDPEILVRGGAEQEKSVQAIKDHLGFRPYIFNLGHGILPQTPLSHVEELVRQVRRI